jgi:hypothetical protein
MKSHRSGFLIAMIFCVAAILAGVLLMAPAARTETVPPDSWAYEALKSFELRGLVALEPTFPYTFNQCEAYTREIAAAVEARGVALGPRHAFLLERLTKQFVGTRDRPEDRWSKPVYTVREDERFAALDVSVGASVKKNADRNKGEANGLAVPGILVGLGRNVTLETNYRLVMAPEWGRNANMMKPSARLRSYRGVTAEFERALLDASGEWWEVRAGREYMHWGSDPREDLILSRTAGSLDHVGARFELGRFALSTFQASLTDDWQRRRFAGHRLTTALPRGVFLGISETVVYQGDVKHMYIVPLGIFYAQQFNEGSNVDNILWELDWKVPLRRGLLFYGEFLIDDFQYQRDENSGPDRLGLHVAADALFMVGGRELELSAGYTHIDTYTYAHFMAGGYVAGDGNAQMNPLLGSSLGPDADRRFIKATLGMSARAAVSVEGAYSKYGSNNQLFNAVLQDWAPSMDNDPAFPTAPVLHVKYVCAGALYDLRNGSFVSAGGGVRFRDGGPDNIDAEEGFGWLEVVLDL